MRIGVIQFKDALKNIHKRDETCHRYENDRLQN
jgi:hypothetical protein